MNKIFLPTNCLSKLDILFLAYPFSRKIRHKIYYILYTILIIAKGNGSILFPVNLKSKDLQSKLRAKIKGKKYNYSDILNLLVEHGIIKINTDYTKPKYCKGKLVQHGETMTYQLCEDVVNSVYTILDINIKGMEEAAPANDLPIQHTIKSLNNLVFDEAGAKQRLVQYINEKEYQKDSEVLIGQDVQETFFKKILVYNSKDQRFDLVRNETRQFVLDNYFNNSNVLINRKDKFFYISLEQYHKIKQYNVIYSHAELLLKFKYKKFNNTKLTKERLYSLFSRMPNIYMPFLSYANGVKLSECGRDIVNSHLAFFSILLQSDDNDLFNFATKQGFNFNDESSQLFFELCGTGKIYEYLENQLGITRDKAKKRLLICLNSKYGDTKVKNLFPNIADFLTAYKKRNGYKSINEALVSAESKTVLRDVLNGYMEQNEEEYLLTKHDEFFPSNVDRFDSFFAAYCLENSIRGILLKKKI